MSDPTVSETGSETGSGTADVMVSVIIPVYNTMPYLTECLSSVLGQSIGAEKLEIVAVDDGSTDGSAEELDRVAAAHPDVVRVLHQQNSGGPAQPCNAGLEVATGRYVFFLGADDYLGTEALERLVDSAEAWNSDVIFGRMKGENGRGVNQRIFARTVRELNFADHELAYALSNCKLFRRSLLSAQQIRYPTGMRFGSDQPFTVAAIMAARRTSVLNGYTFYHAVRRADASNISYATDWRTKLTGVVTIVDRLADLTPAGPVRDGLLRRHFGWELDQLLIRDLPGLRPGEQTELMSAVGGLAEKYLTDAMANRLSSAVRMRVRLAQLGDLDCLSRSIDYMLTHRDRELALVDGHELEELPPLRESHPDFWRAWAQLSTSEIGRRLSCCLSLERAETSGGRLVLTGRTALSCDSAAAVQVAVVGLADTEPVSAAGWRDSAPESMLQTGVELQPETGPGTDTDIGSRLRIELDLTAWPASAAEDHSRWSLRLWARSGGRIHDQPLQLATADLALPSSGLVLVADRTDRLLLHRDADED